MTTQEKNAEIALMIGFQKGFWYSVEKPSEDTKQFCKWDKENTFFGSRIYPKEKLLFHSDANWQFEALEFIEKINHKDKHYQWENEDGKNYNFMGYETNIENNMCSIWLLLELDPPERVAYFKNNSKKEAVFEALFQFSQYIKTK